MEITADQKMLLDEFHRFYYGEYFKIEDGKSYYRYRTDVTWMGTQAMKCPFDLLVIQEIIYDTRPDLVIECGTSDGGTTLFMASICELLHHGAVISIDRDRLLTPGHQQVLYWQEDVLAPDVLERLREIVFHCQRVMVLLDDDHRKDHVLEEMETYGEFVSPGCYLVVEDTNINGHPVFPEFGPGPWEAVEEFLPRHPEFVVDKSREHFGLTYSPNGWLKKV